jgi:hypothetical protein
MKDPPTEVADFYQDCRLAEVVARINKTSCWSGKQQIISIFFICRALQLVYHLHLIYLKNIIQLNCMINTIIMHVCCIIVICSWFMWSHDNKTRNHGYPFESTPNLAGKFQIDWVCVFSNFKISGQEVVMVKPVSIQNPFHLYQNYILSLLNYIH